MAPRLYVPVAMLFRVNLVSGYGSAELYIRLEYAMVSPFTSRKTRGAALPTTKLPLLYVSRITVGKVLLSCLPKASYWYGLLYLSAGDAFTFTFCINRPSPS